MSKRVELLYRARRFEESPFLLCNLLARRAKQLANGQQVATWSGLINVAVTEFLEGRLKYEVDGRRPHSMSSSIAATAVNDERHPSNGAKPERGGRRLASVQ